MAMRIVAAKKITVTTATTPAMMAITELSELELPGAAAVGSGGVVIDTV